MKKKILIIILVLLVILILLPVVYFVCCDIVYSGRKDEAKVAYLRKHRYVVNDSSLAVPPAFGRKIQTGENRVFIFGEQHGFSPNCSLSAQILIFLNRHRGVRTYGAEITAENAETLNRIISSDSLDERALRAVIREIGKDIPQRQTTDCLREWTQIYAYNRSADEDHKIRVVGLLGKDYGHGKLLRDEVMAKTLLAFVQNPANRSLVKNGSYCFVGLTHAFLSPYIIEGREIPTFGSLLKAHRLSVTSMIEMALDSYCYVPETEGMVTPPDGTTKLASSNGPVCFYNHVINMEKASEGTGTAVYALNGDGTPYAGCNDFVGISSSLTFFAMPFQGLPSKSTLDYFQYVFMINGHRSPEAL